MNSDEPSNESTESTKKTSSYNDTSGTMQGYYESNDQSSNMNVMGGNASTNLASMPNNISPYYTNTTTDPGILAPSHNNNQNTSSSALGMPTHHNITISANDIKKELESDDIQTVLGKKRNNDNAISSFIKKTATVIEKSQNERNAALEKQIREQHRLNDWRYRGYCPMNNNTNTSHHAQSNTIDGDMRNHSIHAGPNSSFQPEPCTGGKYYLTKLRNWRTGYDRILSLHNTYFTTLDPETNEITNIWKYTQVKQYALLHPQEEDCLYIDVTDENGRGSTKLKFKCMTQNIYHVMTSFVESKYVNDAMIAASGDLNPYQQKQFYNQNPVFECQRLTRYNTRLNTILICAPHGLVELDSNSRSIPLQTYRYKNMKAVSFVSDEGSGIILYMGGLASVPFANSNNSHCDGTDPCDDNYRICDEKVFFVASIRAGGSGRSDLMTVLKTKLEDLALKLNITESMTLNKLQDRKRQRGMSHGEPIAVFPVFKTSQRIQCKKNQQDSESVVVVTNNNRVMIPRNLVVTSHGYVLEFDKETNVAISVNCRKLKDIFCLVRHRAKDNEKTKNHNYPNESFSIEFKDGSICTYFSSERDVALVSILDITVNLCRNFSATITDVLSKGYSFSMLESPVARPQSRESDTAIFQSDLIEVQCLKKLSNVALTTKLYLNTSVLSEKIDATCMEVCFAIVECCREFNVNVTLLGIRNLPQDESLIMNVIHDLWEIVSYLLNFGDKFKLSNGKISSEEVDFILCVIFQTLYRLMLTPLGFNNTSEDKEVLHVLTHKLHCINDVFTLYWALKCSSALLLPRPFATEREVEKEKMNKNTVINQMPNLAKFLVHSEVSNTNVHVQSSELLLMVVSNIIESVLCSHRDTTSQEHFTMLMEELSSG